MKAKLLKTILGALAFGLVAIAASAQTTTVTPPPPPPPNLTGIGADLKVIISDFRASSQELLAQRRAALEALRAATTDAERATIREALRGIMREHQQAQRELARAIRDAIKARRDLNRPPSGG